MWVRETSKLSDPRQFHVFSPVWINVKPLILADKKSAILIKIIQRLIIKDFGSTPSPKSSVNAAKERKFITKLKIKIFMFHVKHTLTLQYRLLLMFVFFLLGLIVCPQSYWTFPSYSTVSFFFPKFNKVITINFSTPAARQDWFVLFAFFGDSWPISLCIKEGPVANLWLLWITPAPGEHRLRRFTVTYSECQQNEVHRSADLCLCLGKWCAMWSCSCSCTANWKWGQKFRKASLPNEEFSVWRL